MNDESKPTPNPTRLLMLRGVSVITATATQKKFMAKLNNLSILHRNLEYNFVFETPSVISEPNITEYISEKNLLGLGGGEKKTKRDGTNIFFAFSKELTEEELKFWRIFKLGFLSYYYHSELEN